MKQTMEQQADRSVEREYFDRPTLPGRPYVMMMLGHPTTIKKLKDADVIFGSDESTGNVFFVFGRERFEEIVATDRSKEVAIEIVPILHATLELEALLAVTTVAKGHHEYEAFKRKAA